MDYLSDCCSRYPLGELDKSDVPAIGLCSRCKDNTTFSIYIGGKNDTERKGA